MKHLRRLFNAVALLMLFVGMVWQAEAQPIKQPFSSLDVFQLEYAADPQISPDGKQVVYVRRGMDIMKDRKMGRLWITNSLGSEHRKLTSRESNESRPRWSPDGTRIAFVSSSEQGAEIYVYWLESGQFARLTQLERSPGGLSWSPDGQKIAFSMLVPNKAPSLVRPPQKPKGAQWAAHPRVTTRLKHEADGAGYIEPGFNHHFVISSEGGTPRQVTSGDFHHRGTPQWTPDSKRLIISTNRNANWEREFRNTEIYSVSLTDGNITALTDRNGPDTAPVVSPDGDQIAYLGYDDKVQTYQLNKIYLMALDGSGKKEIPLQLDRNPSNLSWNAKGTGLFFQYDDKGNTKLGHVTLSGQFRKVADNIGGTVIGRPYGGGSYSLSDGDEIAFTRTTPEAPADVAIIRKGKEAPQLITNLNSDLLDYRTLGRTEEIWYESSFDGRSIQGWLVYPPDFDSGEKYPLLVENHGGPVSNYGDRFSPEMQLYAAAGYIVFYPNPRGSTSYGEEFGNLLYHNYPAEDYLDVMDGVDAVLSKGNVSSDGLFVTGGSAGGIMTAWMIGKNNRFRAAAVVKPVMNWVSKTLVADNYFAYSNYRYPGQPWENFETYMKFSPLSLVGNIQTPTLVMVGTADLRTPLSEAKQLYHALKIRDIETALVEVPGAYHNISNRPSQLITKVEHVLAWFEKFREK